MQERRQEEGKWNDKNYFFLEMRILFKTYSTKHCSSKWTAKTRFLLFTSNFILQTLFHRACIYSFNVLFLQYFPSLKRQTEAETAEPIKLHSFRIRRWN